MGMEHRWGMRVPAQLDVSIDFRPRGLIHGRVCDLSGSGLFVAVSEVDLPLNTRVEVVCVLQDPGVARIQRLNAIVVRRTPRGVGLAFSQFNPQGLSDLRAPIEAHAPPGVAPARPVSSPDDATARRRPAVARETPATATAANAGTSRVRASE